MDLLAPTSTLAIYAAAVIAKTESGKDTGERHKIASLLDWPTPADIVRLQRIRTNPPRGKQPCQGALGSGSFSKSAGE